MRRRMFWITVAIVTFIGLPLLGLTTFRILSPGPSGLGVDGSGKLSDCPDTPNCVCSFDQRPAHQVESLVLTPDELTRIGEVIPWTEEILSDFTGCQIVTREPNYLHAEFRTAVFGFVDDLQLLWDVDERTLHFRSASRAGRSDFGVNRSRVDRVRGALAAAIRTD
jgi:uncharacterized protein (DUF1499 family)